MHCKGTFGLPSAAGLTFPSSLWGIGVGTRLLAGCTTGAMAVALAQPTDVVKVRFQAQARSPGESRRYCSTIDAYKTIAKEEGVHGLWKGRLVDYCGHNLLTFFFCALTVTLSCRNCSKHRQKRHCELHRTGDLRFNQGHPAQVHSPDRCRNNPPLRPSTPFFHAEP